MERTMERESIEERKRGGRTKEKRGNVEKTKARLFFLLGQGFYGGFIDDEKEQREYELREIYRTIKREACWDLSAIGMGTLDFCNIDVIKAHFGPLFEGKIEMLGYVSRVQDYFRDRRYQIILGMMDAGLTPREVCERTKFSWNMVSKVFEKPDTKRKILEMNKERKEYAETDEL